MHDEIHSYVERVKTKHPRFFVLKRVLDVGSLNINGSTRQHFRKCEYTGIDIGEGPGVDRVVQVHKLRGEGNYDVVVSTSMLEHDRHWERSLLAMYRLLAPRGLLLLTCAGPDFPEHGTTRTTPNDAPFTNDWYRNISTEDFERVLGRKLFSSCDLSYGTKGRSDLLFHGVKNSAAGAAGANGDEEST